jgi:hypothetical protein
MPIVDNLINQDLPNHVRCNHALEHATLHVLQEKGVRNGLGGISDAGGCFIYGEVDTVLMAEAAQEALNRLQQGEAKLAVHPNCGTNLAVGGLAAGGMAWLGMLGTGDKFGRKVRRLPLAVILGLIGYQMAKPLGPKLQEQITTNADVSKLEITGVLRHDVMGHTIHRISTRTTG